jgi:glutathione peroxidase
MSSSKENQTVYDYTAPLRGGGERPLSEYAGKVLLIVNTASECGFTPQLKGLQELQDRYGDEGFQVLGFPSNEFGGQEPLEGDAIEEFCAVNYGVSFPVFDKIHVKGSEQHPLFDFLSDRKRNGSVGAKPRWNFHKYLVGRDGRVLDYFLPITNPDAGRLTRAVEKALKAPAEAV